MSVFPKVGTVEAIVLERMFHKPEGVTYLDFADIGLTDDSLREIVQRLQHGLFESDDDERLKLDA
jgi:hypothetical protein